MTRTANVCDLLLWYESVHAGPILFIQRMSDFKPGLLNPMVHLGHLLDTMVRDAEAPQADFRPTKNPNPYLKLS